VTDRLPPAAESRLGELVEQYALNSAAAASLLRVLALQNHDPTASTTIRDPVAAVDRHVADALVALRLDEVRAARHIADLGSGAGWPGLALAAALPDAKVTLVESAARRCRYLERAIEASVLPNVSVVHARAEDWATGLGAHDLVTARALAALAIVCEYAAPLLALGGALVAWKTFLSPTEAADAEAAAAVLGLESAPAFPVEPFPGARDHVLYTLRKVAPTPDRFPRRPGMATKRPLSAAS
jgi:16S rRNA (guanine527-N7)-methyltransferase